MEEERIGEELYDTKTFMGGREIQKENSWCATGDPEDEDLNSWKCKTRKKKNRTKQRKQLARIQWVKTGNGMALRTKIPISFYRKVFCREIGGFQGAVDEYDSGDEQPLVACENGVYECLDIRPSEIHGLGIFTTVDIKKRSFLMKYEGEVIGKCMANKREKIYIANGIKSVYMFKVDDDMIIDATFIGNKARYMNHSCRPNCYSVTDSRKKCIFYFTNRDIKAGEELTINYHYSEEDKNEVCNCRSGGCRKRSTGVLGQL